MKRKIGKFTIDTSFTIISKILQLIMGIGTSVITARILGPKGQGIYHLSILLPSLIMIFGNLGIAQAAVFHVGRKKYSIEEIIGSNLIFSVVFSIVGCSIGLVLIVFCGEAFFPGVNKLYLFLSLLLLPLMFLQQFINYVLLGLQKIKEFNLVTILQSFSFLILLSILLLIFGFGIKATIIACILSYLIGTIGLFFLVQKIIGGYRLKFSKYYIKDSLKYGFKVYLGNLSGFLHYRMDQFLINIFLNPSAVGFYSLSVSVSEKIWLVSQSAGTVLFPRISSERDGKKINNFTPLICRNILFFSVIGSILLFFLARPFIVMFYSERFYNSILPMQILLIGAVTMSGWKILANDFYGRGRPELNLYIGITSVVLNIILNILWIPKYGIAGAAWATSLSYTCELLVITIIYCKISGNSIYKTIFVQRSDFILYKDLMVQVGQGMIQAVQKMFAYVE